MKKELFVCHTQYHLFISILKSLNNKNNKTKIVLCDQLNNVFEIKEKLLSYAFCDEVDIFLDNYFSKIVKRNPLYKFKPTRYISYYFVRKKMSEHFPLKNFLNYDIYIYNDSSFLFYYLYNHFSEFSLIEDGLRIYDKLDFSLFRNILFFVFRHPHILRDGRSPKIKEIYVQSPELIKDRRAKKTRKLDLKALINNITNEDKKNLIEFYFQTSTSYMNFNKKSVLILTQPLTKSNNVPLQKLLDLYKTIIYFMKQRNYNVYLKPHPVDDTPYNAYFKDIYILPKDIPIEAFNLFERHDLFDLAIALYSSAINNINFVERRLNLFCNNNWQKNLKTDIKEVLYDYVREEI